MLENMGRPDAVWSPRGDSEGGGIGSAEAQRVRSAFRQAFAMAGRGGLLVSEFPGTLQPLQWAPQDIVEIERAKAIKTDICNVFGVPDAKLERNAANLAARQDRRLRPHAKTPAFRAAAQSKKRSTPGWFRCSTTAAGCSSRTIRPCAKTKSSRWSKPARPA